MTISRYLFRDGEVLDKASAINNFNVKSLMGDYMLTSRLPVGGQPSDYFWSAYKKVRYYPSYGWHPQPDSVVQELRALLLLQQ